MAGLLDFLLGGGNGLLGAPAPYGGPGDAGAMMPPAPDMSTTTLSARSAFPSVPAIQVPQQQQAPAASPFGGIRNGLINMLSAMNPQAGNALMQRQLLQSAIQSLPPNMPLAQKLAIIQNPEVQKAMFGAPSQMGTMKLPNGAEVPAYSIHGQAPTYAMPQNPAFQSQLNAPVKLGETKVGDVSGPALYQNGQITTAFPGGGAGGTNGQPGGLQGAIDLNNQVTQQKQKAAALGKAQGEATQKLPQALADADTAIGLIDELKKDPNLWWATGSVLGRLPAVGEGQAEAVARIDQVKGQAFMQAFQALKGAGVRITNQESMSASNAIARLNRAQSTEDFKIALNDLRNVIVGIRTRAGQMAGGSPTPPPPSGTTKSGVKWSIQ